MSAWGAGDWFGVLVVAGLMLAMIAMLTGPRARYRIALVALVVILVGMVGAMAMGGH